MALDRTTTTVKLKSDDGLYYTVSMVDQGDGIVVPEADSSSGVAGTSDTYVALIGSDSQVYRWSLETIVQDGTFVNSLIQLSPDQAEIALTGLDFLFGSQWLRVEVELQDTGGGLIPNLSIVDGSPWTPPATISVRRGGFSSFVRPTARVSTFRRPVSTFATYVNN